MSLESTTTRDLYAVKAPTVPKKLPIDPTTDDPFYRYQMRQLQVQHLGNGKMMRTALLNGDDIAKDLKVPPSYVPHFIAHTLGAKPTYDGKKPERERSFVSGHYSPEQLSELLSTFISKFVLCTQCRLPEWSYVPLKSGRVGLKCRACGLKSYVHELDLQEKFIKFVQNKPPPKTATLDKNAAKGQEAVKAREKQDAKIIKQAEKLDVDVAEEEVEWGTDVSEAAMAARAAEMVPDKLKSIVVNSAAPAADDEEADAEAADEGPDDDDAAADGNDADVVARLFESILSDVADLGAAIKQHESQIKNVIDEAQATRALLFLKQWQTRVEALPEADRVVLKKRVPLVCKALYDADIVEEEHFLAWGKSGDIGALGKLAAPFLTWLAEADDDDEE